MSFTQSVTYGGVKLSNTAFHNLFVYQLFANFFSGYGFMMSSYCNKHGWYCYVILQKLYLFICLSVCLLVCFPHCQLRRSDGQFVLVRGNDLLLYGQELEDKPFRVAQLLPVPLPGPQHLHLGVQVTDPVADRYIARIRIRPLKRVESRADFMCKIKITYCFNHNLTI